MGTIVLVLIGVGFITRWLVVSARADKGVMSPTMKTLTVVFGGMAVMVVAVVGGVLITVAVLGHENYMFLPHMFFGAVIGLIVGVTICAWLGYMVYRDKNAAPPKRRRQIKHLLLGTSLAVLFVGFISYNFNWGFSIYRAAELGKIEAVKQYLDSGGDVLPAQPHQLLGADSGEDA